MIRARLIRWLGGVERDPMATPACQHVWTNWSNPAATTFTTTAWGGEPTQAEVVIQDRRCLKCNLYEWRRP